MSRQDDEGLRKWWVEDREQDDDSGEPPEWWRFVQQDLAKGYNPGRALGLAFLWVLFVIFLVWFAIVRPHGKPDYATLDELIESQGPVLDTEPRFTEPGNLPAGFYRSVEDHTLKVLPAPTTTTMAPPATTTTTVVSPPVAAKPESVAAAQPVGNVQELICSYSWDCGTALRVAECESGFNPRAVGGASERGIFQVHPVHAASLGSRWDLMFDPAENVRFAFELWSSQGWRPWSCF